MLFHTSLLSARPQGRASFVKKQGKTGSGASSAFIVEASVFTKRKCIVKTDL